MTREQLAEEVSFLVHKMRDQVQNMKLAVGAEQRIRPSSPFVATTSSAATVLTSQIADLEKLVGAYAVSKDSGAVPR